MQRGMNARNDAIPLAGLILPKQAGGRVPWTVFAIEQPTPAGIVSIEEPKWFAECASKMHHRGIHGNDQVQIFDQRGSVRKVM